jgi:hypothetical protein
MAVGMIHWKTDNSKIMDNMTIIKKGIYGTKKPLAKSARFWPVVAG